MCNSLKSVWSLVICRTSCSVTQAYGPLTVTHRYPLATKSLTGIPGEYPSEGKSFAQVVQVTLKPIIETTNSPIFMISPFPSDTETNRPADRPRHFCACLNRNRTLIDNHSISFSTSAKQAPVTSPTYPDPTIAIFITGESSSVIQSFGHFLSGLPQILFEASLIVFWRSQIPTGRGL